jgi:hypothetical protein
MSTSGRPESIIDTVKRYNEHMVPKAAASPSRETRSNSSPTTSPTTADAPRQRRQLPTAPEDLNDDLTNDDLTNVFALEREFKARCFKDGVLDDAAWVEWSDEVKQRKADALAFAPTTRPRELSPKTSPAISPRAPDATSREPCLLSAAPLEPHRLARGLDDGKESRETRSGAQVLLLWGWRLAMPIALAALSALAVNHSARARHS